MKVLFFDATQDWIHISVSNIAETIAVLYETNVLCPKESSFRLISEIRQGLLISGVKKPDIIFCLTGPGSFTGVRITVATAKNLAQLWNLPVFGIDSIFGYCLSFSEHLRTAVYLAIDGKQNKHYFGKYLNGAYSGSADLSISQLEAAIEKNSQEDTTYVFSGVRPICFPENSIKIEETLPKSMPILRHNRNQILKIKIKHFSYSDLTPNYVRGSYVETNQK